jgi:RNA polymerase sigma-70 factor (ECF subfamily)
MSLPISIDKMYDKYYYTFVGLAQSYFPNSEVVYDVAQETLIKAWVNRDKYNSKNTLSTWLKRIFVNTAIDHKRRIEGNKKNKRTFLRDIDDEFQNFRCDAINVDTIDLEEHLDKLKFKDAFTIYQRYIAGHTQQQIADNYGMTIGEVKSNERSGS